MDGGASMDEVRREVELEVGVEEAWQAVISPAGWLAEEAALELVAGGEAEFLVEGERRSGWVEEVSPGERLVFWWGDPATRVELELEPLGEELTRVRVRESRPLEVAALCGLPLPERGGTPEGPLLLAA